MLSKNAVLKIDAKAAQSPPAFFRAVSARIGRAVQCGQPGGDFTRRGGYLQ